MAYPHSRLQMPTAVGAGVLDITTTGDKARISSPYLRSIVRAVAVELNAAPGSNNAIRFDKRITFGSDTGRGTGDVAVLNLLTSHAAGRVVYKDNLNVVLDPGQEVVVTIPVGIAALSAVRVTVYVEPFYENPANITSMVASS
jgi:hypothetical protein